MTWVDWLDLASAAARGMFWVVSTGCAVAGFAAWHKGDVQRATLYIAVALLLRGGQ